MARVTEDDIEILCNDELLPMNCTLATIRAFIWKRPEDLQLQYRPKQPPK